MSRQLLDLTGLNGDASEEDEQEEELLGYISDSIVGIQYYTGEVNKNEMVQLVREPRNPYDRWAVRVDNVRGEKVGHLPRKLVLHLAPLVDQGVLSLEGLVPHGNKNVYKMPVHLFVFARPGAEEEVIQAILDANQTLLDPGTGRVMAGGGGGRRGSGAGGSSSSQRAAASAAAAAAQVSRLTPQEMSSSIDRLFEELLKEGQGSEEHKRLKADPEVTAPLYPHQQEALAWMVSRENCSGLPPLWEPALGPDGRLRYVSQLTNFATAERPAPLRGGILADDMGLGKTLQVVALIATNKPGAGPLQVELGTADPGAASPGGASASAATAAAAGEAEGDQEEGRPRKKQRRDKDLSKGKGKGKAPAAPAAASKAGSKKGQAAAEAARLAAEQEGGIVPPAANGPRATLIVCPLSVLSNWQQQIEEHTAGNLNVYSYHGPQRNRKASFLASHDVVLTTYSMLQADAAASGAGGLLKVIWLRVVLDEAHTVKNGATATSRAAQALQAERRWAVTGTPIQNSLGDLQGVAAFLHLEPLSDRALFMRTIERPIKQREPLGLKRLQVLMGAVALRRTKTQQRDGKPLVSLPRKVVNTLHVRMDRATLEKYRKWEAAGQRVVSRLLAQGDGTLLQNYTAVLEIILRLRQICCHAALVPKGDPSFSAQLAQSAALTPEVQARLVELLKAGLVDDCPICLSPPDAPVITLCKHIFCRRCIEAVIARDKPSCPMCRSGIRGSELVALPEGEEAEASQQVQVSQEGAAAQSAKIAALIARLRADETAAAAAGETAPLKSVVFSQFTQFLELVQSALAAEGFKCLRLDGRTLANKRGELLRAFASTQSGSPTVLLVSLKAGGTGLNLCAASRVHLLDPWWNPAVEEQAMDRVHRLGQQRDVMVYRYAVEDSIEERLLALQENKRELMKAAFERRTAQDMRAMRLRDVRLLMDLED